MDKDQQEFTWADAARPKMAIRSTDNSPSVVIVGDTTIASDGGVTVYGANRMLKTHVGAGEPAPFSASKKPEVADKPGFIKDVKNGLVHVAKVAWQVPAARGYLATLLVRYGVPSAVITVVSLIIDGLVN